MKRLSTILPAINVLFLVVVSVMFIVAHHGWSGDAEWHGSLNDTVASPSDKGLVFFNRWNFNGSEESTLTKTFLFINIPAFVLARLTLRLLETFWEEFGTSQPLGLSYGSYTLILSIPLSIVQWWVIGRFIERIRPN